jgi:glycosyltransferase involved in cell wall biosynthesis
MYDISSARRRARDAGIDVHWHLRHIPRDEIGVYFAAADVVVLPYLDTSDSGVLELAAAFGRPVVVSRSGGLEEAFARYGYGEVVPPRNPHALAAAIQRHHDPALRQAPPSNSWGDVAVGHESLYRGLLAGAGLGKHAQGAA